MALFAETIFLGSFLLFQLELIIARIVLPWFGGAAAVWTTCLLFFQIMLGDQCLSKPDAGSFDSCSRYSIPDPLSPPVTSRS